MTYKYPTISELSFIQVFGDQGTKAYIAAKSLKRSAETIYRIYRSLDAGYSITEYHENYKANKSKADRKPISLPSDDLDYIKEKGTLFLTPDTIVGRNEKAISSRYTLFTVSSSAPKI